MKLGLDVTFTLRMIIMFIYRLPVTHDFGCNDRHLPIAIWIWLWIWMADGWWLQVITDGYCPSACQFRIATSNDLSAIAIASALCHCSLQITDGHFDHLLRVTLSHWLPVRMNDLPMARWPIVIYWLRTTDCHFDYRGEEPIATSNFRLLVAHYMVPNNYHFAVPITDCRLQREWIR